MQSTFGNFLILILFLTVSTAQAQLEEVMHQTFEVGIAETISLDLVGEYEIEKWAGNTVMTETKVELYEASPAILNHFVNTAERYKVVVDTLNNQLHLSSFDKKREPIRRNKTKECPEIVHVRVFVPDTFEMTADSMKTLIRKKVEVD